MKEVFIYGGAFNPPTVAHQEILQACVSRAAQTDAEVWLMLSGERADKTIATPKQQRLKLAKALCESVVLPPNVRIVTKTEELDATQLTETYETHRQLQAANPETRFTWLFGSDSIRTMQSWKQGEWLYKNLGMLVIPRPGIQCDELPPNAELLPVNVTDVSSTLVRTKVANKESVADMVPAAVVPILEYT